VAVSIVTHSLDNNTRNIIPCPGPLYLKPNNLLSFNNLISILSRFHHHVGRGNRSNIYRGLSGIQDLSTSNPLTLVAIQLVAVFSQCLLADLVRCVTFKTGAPSRSMTIVFIKIGGLEKDITNPWIMPLGPWLLKGVKILLSLVLKFPASILHTKTI
jgi:hypothetical protein